MKTVLTASLLLVSLWLKSKGKSRIVEVPV